MKFPVLETRFMWLNISTSGSPEAKEVTHTLCVEVVPRGSGTLVAIGDASKSSSHPRFVFSPPAPLPQLCQCIAEPCMVKDRAGFKWTLPSRKAARTTQICDVQRKREGRLPTLFLLPLSLTEAASQS